MYPQDSCILDMKVAISITIFAILVGTSLVQTQPQQRDSEAEQPQQFQQPAQPFESTSVFKPHRKRARQGSEDQKPPLKRSSSRNVYYESKLLKEYGRKYYSYLYNIYKVKILIEAGKIYFYKFL